MVPSPALGIVAALRSRPGSKDWLALGIVGGLLLLPLFAACIWLYPDRSTPIFDMALFEMHVRDVGTRHTPLVGLGGRLARLPELGSHPGPLAFYVLAPIFRLLGGSYWALRVSTATVTASAIVGALVLARRRGGAAAVIALGTMLGLLELGFGLLVMTEPWNPFLPVFVFPTFLLAAWSVLAGDVTLLPLVAFLGSFCGLTHISYLAVCGGLGILAFLTVAARWIHAARAGRPRRELRTACWTAIAVTAALWAPPVLQELTEKRGNMTVVLEYLARPAEPSLGFAVASSLMVERLDFWFALRRVFGAPGILCASFGAQPSARAGVIVLSMWLGCAAYALKSRDRGLVSLHVTTACAFLIGLVSTSRIPGWPFAYLTFNGWWIGALVLLSIFTSAGRFLKARGIAASTRLLHAFAIAAVALVGACAVRLAATRESSLAGAPVGKAARCAFTRRRASVARSRPCARHAGQVPPDLGRRLP